MTATQPLSPLRGDDGRTRFRDRLPSRARSSLLPIVALAAIVAVGLVALASGTVDGTVATLIVIGFSPDRSTLIAAMTVEAVAVAAGAFIVPRLLPTIVGGLAVLAIVDGPTFRVESTAAMASTGAAGVFDPIGWALTLGSLLATGIVIAWSVTALTAIVRRHLLLALSDLRALPRDGTRGGRLRRPVAVGVVLVVLAATMPVLGDMLNYEPDVDMRHGAGSRIGLADTGPLASLPANLPDVPAAILSGGGILGPNGLATLTPPATMLSTARPWLAWRPTGTGVVQVQSVPAPYGPPGTTSHINVYLPPGYSTSTQRYPVMYAVPWSINPWLKGASITTTLDALITSGAIPPVIVVFSSEAGGPFADSQCADSRDGRVWYATWLVHTVVARIDAAYRTIPEPQARGVMGFSQGGFCSPMLVLRDPTVFTSALSFSGYFQAGIQSNQTVNASLPFGGDPTYEALFSPVVLAFEVPAALRKLLFVELASNPSAPFYGPQYVAFSRVLDGAGIPAALFPNPIGHAWAGVRLELAPMLTDWAERMTALNVFGA